MSVSLTKLIFSVTYVMTHRPLYIRQNGLPQVNVLHYYLQLPLVPSAILDSSGRFVSFLYVFDHLLPK